MNQTINLEEQFAKWLQEKAPDSYRPYLGNLDKTIERLREINRFFPERNLFEIENNNSDIVKDFIITKTSREGRLNNPEFDQYDAKKSNGIPKAIIGQQNYFKFLDEYFSERDTTSYWLFQGSPKIYNISKALRGGHLKSWKVAAHKEKIKPGDKAILWQTGEKAGCYALLEIISEIGELPEEDYELQYYVRSEDKKDMVKHDRVKIKITHYLADHPILWEDIKSLPELQNLKAGYQGTNFSATEEEYNALLKIALNRHEKIEGEKEFLEVVRMHDPSDVDDYFEFLDAIIEKYDIETDDERVVTGTSDKQLNLTIRQRYCWNLYKPDTKKGKFGMISDEPLTEKYHTFKGSGPKAFYNQFEEYSFAVENKESAFSAIEKELDRKHKSSFTQFNNPAYRKAIFDKDYRKYILENSEFILSQLPMESPKPATPINQILYGPPGTGKTYKLKQDYFSKYTLREASLTSDMFFEETVRDLTWWQVIALALLETGTSKVTEILANRWVAKKAGLSESKNVRATIWGTLQMHTVHESETVKYAQRQTPLIFDKNPDKSWKILENEVKDQYPELYDIRDSVNDFKPNPHKEIKHYVFTTFHQSFAYEDFIEGIKPILDSSSNEKAALDYEIKDGVFKALCLRAQSDPGNRYAIFIDEINRGNVSAIFGELITLIEPDKRLSAKNEIKVRLPYSKTDFGVPSNVDIYGTMNTADRSVEALDTALRRRFSFKEVMPEPWLLENKIFNDFNLEEVLKCINQRIEFLLDRDHTIGHSYFLDVASGDTEALHSVFKNKIIPLLQEYFYHDYEKIALILGSGFVKVTTNHAIRFEKMDGIDEPSSITLCELRTEIESIEEAIIKLLNRNE